jgi:hypothetical protein
VWLAKDPGWWGFWISILALLGAYPLSLLANLTSPRIQNWWAARSRASLEKRIAQLEAALAAMQHDESITNVESYTLFRIDRLELHTIVSVHILLGTAFGAALFTAINTQTHWVYWIVGATASGTVVNLSRVFWPDKHFEYFRSSNDERDLRKDIEKLKADLTKRK